MHILEGRLGEEKAHTKVLGPEMWSEKSCHLQSPGPHFGFYSKHHRKPVRGQTPAQRGEPMCLGPLGPLRADPRAHLPTDSVQPQ